MKDKELKQLLNNAYALSETKRGKQFVRSHQKRELLFCDILILELKHMGIKSLICLIAMMILSLLAVYRADVNTMWLVASLLPVCSLVPMSLLRSSERFQMAEIESASRFSLRFIKLIQMLVAGVFSMALVGLVSAVLNHGFTGKPAQVLLCLLIPYLFSIWGGLFITRKWHSEDNLFAVAALSLLSGFLPAELNRLLQSAILPNFLLFAFCICLLLGTAAESIKFANERSNISWNLC